MPEPVAATPEAAPAADFRTDVTPEPALPEEPRPEPTEPVTGELATAEQAAAEPAAGEPVRTDLISSELAPKLTLDDIEAPPPVAPDLEAVPTQPPAPVPPAAPGLDLPGVDYAEQSARMAYGQPEPQAAPPAPPAPPADPYAATPYAAQPHYGQPSSQYGQPTPYGQPGQAPYGQSAQYAEPAQPYADPAQSQYAQGGYSQPQFGQAPAYPMVPYNQQLSPADEVTWSSAAHWSAILASFVGLGFLGPLLVMLIQGPKSARVRANAVESLNFEITYVLAMIASVLLMLVVIGFVTIFLVPLVWLILRIVAAVQTSGGNDYRYPVNIRLVK